VTRARLFVERDAAGRVILHVNSGKVKLTPRQAQLLALRLTAASSADGEKAVHGVGQAVNAGKSAVAAAKGAAQALDDVAGAAADAMVALDKIFGGGK
jgi:hypothetical protein